MSFRRALRWVRKKLQETFEPCQWLRKWSEVKWLSRVWLFATLWTVAYQVPPPMGFSRQEYWSGLPFPSPGNLPNLGIEPRLPHWSQTLQPLSHQGSPSGKPLSIISACPNLPPFLNGICRPHQQQFPFSQTLSCVELDFLILTKS